MRLGAYSFCEPRGEGEKIGEKDGDRGFGKLLTKTDLKMKRKRTKKTLLASLFFPFFDGDASPRRRRFPYQKDVALPPLELRGDGAPGGRRSPRAAACDPAAAAVWRRRAQGSPRLRGDREAVRKERKREHLFSKGRGICFRVERHRIDLALSPCFPGLVALFLVASGLEQSGSTHSRQRKSRMRTSERVPDA